MCLKKNDRDENWWLFTNTWLPSWTSLVGCTSLKCSFNNPSVGYLKSALSHWHTVQRSRLIKLFWFGVISKMSELWSLLKQLQISQCSLCVVSEIMPIDVLLDSCPALTLKLKKFFIAIKSKFQHKHLDDHKVSMKMGTSKVVKGFVPWHSQTSSLKAPLYMSLFWNVLFISISTKLNCRSFLNLI